MHTTTPLVAIRRSSPCSAGGQHPYGEDESSRLEDGPLPAKEGFLEPIVDAVFREAVAIDQQLREAKRCRRARSNVPLIDPRMEAAAEAQQVESSE